MRERRNEQGFTLIELLLAIVVVGVLSVVAIVGLSGLTKTGNNSACQSAVGSAQAAAATYYANTGNYPPTAALDAQGYKGFDALVQETPALLTLPAGVTVTGDTMKQGTSWTVLMINGGAMQTKFTNASGGLPCT